MKHLGGKGALLVGLALVPLAAGCASQQTLQEYQDEITALREERTRLKKDNRELELQVDDYAVALAEASTQLESRSESLSYPDLDALGVDYGQRDGNLYISIPSEITFASGKAKVTKGGKQALKAVASTLSADYTSGVFWIEGHTDADPIKKSNWESNRDLSVARAMAVLHYLVEDAAIADEQCVVAGHGQYRPLTGNGTKSEKARNRRVEIVVHMPRG